MKDIYVNKLDFAVELDVWWWSTLPEIRESANFITKKIYEPSDCKLKEKRLKNTLKVLLVNLHVAHSKSPKLYIAIGLNKNEYRAHKKFGNIFLKYEYVSYLINYLRKNGYIEYHTGVNTEYFKRKTRIKATRKLLRLFRKNRKIDGKTFRRTVPVKLRDEVKNEIAFNLSDDAIKSLVQNVNKINKCLSLHSVSINANKIKERELLEIYKHDWAIHSHRTQYTRVFNNSTFKNGGRFYNHWSQSIKSELRKYITIDDMETIELDYSCLHLYMLYCLAGLPIPKDDLYELKGIDTENRKYIKKSVNIVLNAKDELSAIRAIQEEYRKFVAGLSFPIGFNVPKPKELLEALKITHQPLKDKLCSNYGVVLQNLDSQIAEQIMLDLFSRNICCLCVHDSFIVADKYEHILRDSMTRHFENMFGIKPRITPEEQLF